MRKHRSKKKLIKDQEGKENWKTCVGEHKMREGGIIGGAAGDRTTKGVLGGKIRSRIG